MKNHRCNLKKAVKTIKVMGETISNTLFYFTEEGFSNALEKLDWHIDKDGFIRDKNKNFVKCDCCKKSLTKSELSAFSSGSVKPLCSNVKCYIVDMYRREKMR